MRLSVVTSALAFCIAIAQPIVAATECDPISKYTTKWFLENTKPEWRSMSFDSTALFYTQGLSEKAKQFARQAINNKITIWDVWPCENYFIIGTRQNRLSCIMSDVKQEMTYFENMSRAFAMKAANVAAVMHRDINNPPMSTIWGRVELPMLQAPSKPWGTVDYITAIDSEDVANRKLEWFRYWSDRLFDYTEPMVQKILHGRSEDAIGNLERRGESEACPIVKIRKDHPLY